MILEITYVFIEDKGSDPVTSWTYYHTNQDDFKKAVTSAGKYFKSFVRDLGWTRKTKLKSIALLRNEQDPAPVIAIIDKPNPKRRSTSRKKKG